jgi:DNA-binding NtrC family response regulator
VLRLFGPCRDVLRVFAGFSHFQEVNGPLAGRVTAAAPLDSAPVGRGVKAILVVDDEPSIRLLCRINLELEGLAVLEAGTLAEARRLLEVEDVGVLLLDVHVGGERGSSLLDELRDAEHPLRVALLTGAETLTEAETASADAILRKPFAIDVLTDTVRRLLSYVDSGIR